MIHGYFLNMGGFVLMKGEEDLGTVSCELFQRLHESGDIEFPTVTEEVLKDSSKRDPLSKGVCNPMHRSRRRGSRTHRTRNSHVGIL